MKVNEAFEGDGPNGSVTLKSVQVVKSPDSLAGEHHVWQNKLFNQSNDRQGRGEAKLAPEDSSNDSNSSQSDISGSHEDIESIEVLKPRETIAVIGSGDFGRALSSRLVQAGYEVNIGSRDPQRNAELVEKVGANPRFQDEAIRSSNVVIVAVPKHFYEDLPTKLLAGKTVVDVSNRNTVQRKTILSQAEQLQALIPEAHVVKAFNVLSAYSLESGGLQGSKEVFLAGDSHEVKDIVTDIIRRCGFIPVDMGLLMAAREIEDIPVQRFSNWKRPLIISTIFFVILWLLSFIKMQICWTLEWGDGSWHWERFNQLPMETLNRTLSLHALTLLATCYLPGVLAAYLQLFRGTKYSRFPSWLDQWLKMRKQLGLLMLFSACLHACLSVAVMSPTYHDLVYGHPTEILAHTMEGEGWGPKTLVANQTVKVFGEEKMMWRGEFFLTTGVLAFALAVVLGITSLPSVTASMTWKEFAFVQSKLGWICLILACAHNLFYGWPYLNGPSCHIPSSFQYVMYLPGLTMLLKIPLVMPCISNHLEAIRGGYERRQSEKKLLRKSKVEQA